MRIIGVETVEAVAASGLLQLAPGDRVTPLARDRAAELGVEVLDAPAGGRGVGAASTPASPRVTDAPLTGGIPRVALEGPGSLPSPPVPALFRRGAPYPGLRGRDGATPAAHASRVGRVTVVGAGNVGTHTAMRLAEADLVDEIVLVDVVEGLARGVALDLTHAAGLLGFSSRIRGESTIDAAGPSEYTVITAGRARLPGMSRTDLTETNAQIVGDLAATIGRVSAAGVIVVVTNPLDEMTELAWRRSGLPDRQVVGMAGLLDSARFQALAGMAAGTRADEVSGIALGSHGAEMVFPASQARVGVEAASARLGGRLSAIVERARDSGAEVVGLLGRGSAFITPGLAAARMVEAMIRGNGALLSATVRPHGEYGISDVYVGLPVRLGRTGLAEIVALPLDATEAAALREAAEKIRARVAGLGAPSARL